MNTTVELPTKTFVLSADNSKERKKVFDLLVKNNVPIANSTLMGNGEICPEYPYLYWHSTNKHITEVSVIKHDTFLLPKDFLAQFGIEYSEEENELDVILNNIPTAEDVVKVIDEKAYEPERVRLAEHVFKTLSNNSKSQREFEFKTTHDSHDKLLETLKNKGYKCELHVDEDYSDYDSNILYVEYVLKVSF